MVIKMRESRLDEPHPGIYTITTNVGSFLHSNATLNRLILLAKSQTDEGFRVEEIVDEICKSEYVGQSQYEELQNATALFYHSPESSGGIRRIVILSDSPSISKIVAADVPCPGQITIISGTLEFCEFESGDFITLIAIKHYVSIVKSIYDKTKYLSDVVYCVNYVFQNSFVCDALHDNTGDSPCHVCHVLRLAQDGEQYTSFESRLARTEFGIRQISDNVSNSSPINTAQIGLIQFTTYKRVASIIGALAQPRFHDDLLKSNSTNLLSGSNASSYVSFHPLCGCWRNYGGNIQCF